MNRRGRLFAGLLAFCLMVQLCSLNSFAAEVEEPYTYQITFYAGNQGVFPGTGQIQVVDAQNRRVPAQVTMRSDGSAITVENLEAGSTVTFDDIQGSGVNLEENSQYYVRGLRKGGYDNDTVTSPAFRVEQDQDYVVAYGIRGEMVSYVIHYQDAAGNALAPSRTYYGNVGDRPVVAFVYIEGYEPQAYNLTKTLSKNEADNVFTFVYTPVPAGGGGGGTGGGETTEETVVNGGVTVVEPGGAGTGGGGGATAPDEGEGEQGEEGEDVPLLDMQEEEVPLAEGPEDLIDLDEEEVPLAYRIGNLEEGATNMLGAVVVGASALAALIVMTVILVKRRKKQAAAEEQEK